MSTKPRLNVHKAIEAAVRRESSNREAKGVKVEQAVIDRIVAGVMDQLPQERLGDWFGPNQPLKPIAQEQAVGRLRDYATGYNLKQSPRHEESAIEFKHLRALADSCDILRLVLETRKDQIEAIDWKIKGKEGCQVEEKDLAQITAFFMQPSTECDWSGWIRQILEDLFVIDAVALYPRLTLGGALYSLDVMDGATIKRLIDEGGRTPIPPEPAYQQVLKGVPAVNYTTDELIYFMRNPRSHKFYGYSPVEQIITYVNMAIRKALHQLEFYTEGNIPESIAGVPDTWTTEQIKEFQMYWDALIEGNTAVRRKMRFVPLDPTKIKETRQVDLKDQFDEWIARVVCYAFSVSPSAFVKDQNRATAETIAENAKLEGLIPVLRFLKRRNDLVIAKYIGRSDVEFSWELNEAIDAKTQAEVDQIYVTMKAITPDWVRKERFGLQPMTEEEKKAAFPAPPNPLEALMGGKQPPGAEGDDEGAAAGEIPDARASQAGGGGKVPPQLQQGRKNPNKAPKSGEDEDPLQRFIGKLVIAPTINVPERSVTVGDVNVHAHVPTQPKEN